MESPSDWTPLHAAVWAQRSIQDIQSLADSYSVNVQDDQGWTPLHLACTSSTSMLMYSHQTSNRPTWSRGRSILARPPLRYGYGESERTTALEVLRILLRHQPTLTIRAKGFCTALHCAANSGWYSHVKLLVDSGAPVYTGPQCSPLCWSAGGSGGMDAVGTYLRQRLGETGLAMIEADHERDMQDARRRQLRSTMREMGETMSDDELALQEALMNSMSANSEPEQAAKSFSGVLPRAPERPAFQHGEVNEYGLCKTCAGMSISAMRKAPGYIHMPSLKDLRFSANFCRLCAIILARLGVSYSGGRIISQVIVSLSNGNHFTCTDPSIFRTVDFMLSEGCTCAPTLTSAEPSPSFASCEGRCKFFKQTSIVVYVKDGDAQGIQSGIDINPNLMHDGNKRTILNWMRKCDHDHVLCKRRDTIDSSGSLDVQLPTRVIEVKDGSVRLVDGAGKKGLYLALSHRWVTGAKPDWVTQTNSVGGRHDWFSTSTLPATVTDACKITSWLGFKYVWIDSLCIVQDSAEDWAKESARMASIYADAYCTLFADCARDDNDGFLRARKTCASTAIKIEGAVPDKPLTLNIRGAPGTFASTQKTVFDRNVQESYLSDRAWIFQERILSKRILHFGEEQLFWQCNELVQAEDGHIVTEDECGDREARFSKRGYSVVVDSSLPYGSLRERISLLRRYSGGPNWMNVVMAYSKLKLTHPSDKLPALSGLASAYARRRNADDDVYIAGLWKSSLATMLAWRVDCSPSQLLEPPSSPRPPSFSWVAVDNPVKFAATESREWAEIAKFISVATEPEMSDSFGRLKSCSLVVQGPVMQLMTYGPLTQTLGSLHKGYVPLYIDEDNNRCPVGHLYPDCLLELDPGSSEHGIKVTCLHLLAPKEESPSSKYEHDRFLVLEPVAGGVQTYRRLGLGSARTSSGARDYLDKPLFENAELQTLTLV